MTTAHASPKTDTDSEASPRPYHWTVDAYDRAGVSGVFEPDIQLELIRGKIIDRFAEGGPAEYRWTADVFDRACDAGVFGSGARLELIHGRIMDRMGQGPLHSILTTLIAERLRAVLSPHLLVREEKPIRIAFDGEPVMDIMVVSRTILDALRYYAAHQLSPEDVLLAVEIAVSSAAGDTGDKALLYAQAGITDYWVVLPEEGEVLVHRGPTPDGYASVVSVSAREVIAPLAAPEVALVVRDLLGLGDGEEGRTP